MVVGGPHFTPGVVGGAGISGAAFALVSEDASLADYSPVEELNNFVQAYAACGAS
jgi:hypothetical protein